MWSKILLSLLFALTATPIPISADRRDGKYTISGSVIDSDGMPVASARVTVMPISSPGTAGELISTDVDHNARFRIALAPGRYVIRAKDEGHGYPDQNFLFSADPNARFPEIFVQDSDISGIKVILGSKGGIIEGFLRDKVTFRPISNGKVILRDAAKLDVFVEVTADKNGHFKFAVPNKPILISASAPNYSSANFQNGGQLTLSGGEQRNITIDLQPK